MIMIDATRPPTSFFLHYTEVKEERHHSESAASDKNGNQAFLRQGVHTERRFISHYPHTLLSNTAARCDIQSYSTRLI